MNIEVVKNVCIYDVLSLPFAAVAAAFIVVFDAISAACATAADTDF